MHILRSLAVAALLAVSAAAPALAAPGNDGTSNTIEYAVTSAKLDAAHHRVLVTSPDLKPGMHLPRAILVTSELKWTFQDVLVESLTSSAVSLNFTQINVDEAPVHCPSGASSCLMEPDGLSF